MIEVATDSQKALTAWTSVNSGMIIATAAFFELPVQHPFPLFLRVTEHYHRCDCRPTGSETLALSDSVTTTIVAVTWQLCSGLTLKEFCLRHRLAFLFEF